ncbi:AraC family transcriptional regulator [Pararobbsia silviterrae]|uniref:AraC family transcriptional regulator n=1 Tax=Pararobbsia silviterrae TaxID=1792498 RepID=A0A494Y522_9BURK|nr:AraC family transcriptional regulator [Pararobbsia silviterrae]RKP55661.1 AraC family transcriptional regulator [Pararobbsia silviterrae]
MDIQASSDFLQQTALDRQLDELAGLIERFTGIDGVHETAVPGLMLTRMSNANKPRHSFQQPALAVIAQCSKKLIVGNESYVYDPLNYLVTSVNLPGVAEIVGMSPEHPYLSLRFDLNVEHIGTLLREADLPASASQEATRGVFMGRLSPALLDAVVRLVRLLDAPDDIKFLAPLIEREILYRLIIDGQGARLSQIALTGSHTQRIAKAISLLRDHYDEPLRIETIARNVNMSPSSLHHHFKAVTAMSPLQYQKQLRLHEARRLMLSEVLDAATASHRVGYESASQFSREYRRLFGEPPLRDITRLREADVPRDAIEPVEATTN